MKIAFIGLGNPGGPMAHNLQRQATARAFDLPARPRQARSADGVPSPPTPRPPCRPKSSAQHAARQPACGRPCFRRGRPAGPVARRHADHRLLHHRSRHLPQSGRGRQGQRRGLYRRPRVRRHRRGHCRHPHLHGGRRRSRPGTRPPMLEKWAHIFHARQRGRRPDGQDLQQHAAGAS